MLLLNEQQILNDSLVTNIQMTFKEIISFNNIDLDSIMVDKLFHNINNDLPIYMDESMVEYFGYSGLIKTFLKICNKILFTTSLSTEEVLSQTFSVKSIQIRRQLS